MRLSMNTFTRLFGLVFLSILMSACSDAGNMATEGEVVKGPHGGRLLTNGDFSLELSIFETGVPPEFRAWATQDGEVLKPNEVDLNITLTRLGGKVDNIKFKPQGDALRGDTVIYEPHSFIVTINASHEGTKHTWEYDNFEGRTKIEMAVAKALEIETEIADAVILQETISAYGKIVANKERVNHVRARFDGVIKSVSLSVGDTVRKGQTLATVESNTGLNLYAIKAPISGVISQRHANTGEQTAQRQLFTIMDTSTVWLELSIFPADRARVVTGTEVTLENSNTVTKSTISNINVMTEANQSVKARVILDNKLGQFFPGSYVNAKIKVATHPVPLAVKRSGLQAFRDFTVVYAQIGEEYEVRMLELGREAGEWVEVLGGLEAGTKYVSKNSYVIKADIEKSGASHDH